MSVRIASIIGLACVGLVLLSGCEAPRSRQQQPSSSTSSSLSDTSTVTQPSSSVVLTPLPKVLDQSAVQDGVQRVLQGSFELKVSGSVSCPDKQPVEVGHTFDCHATIDGKPKTITVTVRTMQGEYEVAAPR